MKNRNLLKPVFFIILISALSVPVIVMSAQSTFVESSCEAEVPTDASGARLGLDRFVDKNKASTNAPYAASEENAEALYALVDEILSEIIISEMSRLDKARVIHSWIRKNIKYTAAPEKKDVIDDAYFGLRNRHGDCFTFYAISEVFLSRAGIDNKPITQSRNPPGHFWNLVNVGDGWYHFDATPPPENADTFMFTNAQAEEYTLLFVSVPGYYEYDKSRYPDIVSTQGTSEVTITKLSQT